MHELLVAFALLLILEGILPFLSPQGLRQALLLVARESDRTLRITGLVSMLAGLGLLYWIN